MKKKWVIMVDIMEALLEEKNLISQVPIGAIFRHYKGKEYKVLHIGRHSEDLSYCVVYQGLYHSEEFGKYPIWIRPLKMFLENVTISGKAQPRFTLTYLPPSSPHD